MLILLWPSGSIAMHLIWPSLEAEMFHTGDLRALGLTLPPSDGVLKLPDMTAYGGFFQSTEGRILKPS